MSLYQDVQAQRGRRIARVIVDIYENGEAVPQVQTALGASGNGPDTIKTFVEQASAALGRWR